MLKGDSKAGFLNDVFDGLCKRGSSKTSRLSALPIVPYSFCSLFFPLVLAGVSVRFTVELETSFLYIGTTRFLLWTFVTGGIEMIYALGGFEDDGFMDLPEAQPLLSVCI